MLFETIFLLHIVTSQTVSPTPFPTLELRDIVGVSNDWGGGDGDDYFFGHMGEDTIDGGDGDDTIHGGSHADTIDGGAGDDSITGDKGPDTIDGGSGHDTLDGGRNADTIDGGDGDDTINGGNQDDTIDGGAGDDIIMGDEGDDTIDGGDGDDELHGDTDNSTGSGSDTIRGGAGDDLIYGYRGDDTIYGGTGDDVIHPGKLSTGTGRNADPTVDGDQVYTGAGNDEVRLDSTQKNEVYVSKTDSVGFLKKIYDCTDDDTLYFTDVAEAELTLRDSAAAGYAASQTVELNGVLVARLYCATAMAVIDSNAVRLEVTVDDSSTFLGTVGDSDFPVWALLLIIFGILALIIWAVTCGPCALGAKKSAKVPSSEQMV